jgi:hypothetical protein
MKKPEPPHCSAHLAVRMEPTGESFKLRLDGQLVGWGHRFRCPIEGCHCCDVIEIQKPKPEPKPVRRQPVKWPNYS